MKTLFSFAFLLFARVACAQMTGDSTIYIDMPAPATAGCEYAKCFIEDEVESLDSLHRITNVVLGGRRSYRLTQKMVKISDEVFENIVDSTVLYKTDPRFLQKTGIKLPKNTQLIPAIYKTTTIAIQLKPEYTKWVWKRGNANCLSQNPDDCIDYVLVHIPAVLQHIEHCNLEKMPRKIAQNDTLDLTPEELNRYFQVEREIKQFVYSHDIRTQNARYKTVEVGRIPLFKNQVMVRVGGFTEWKQVVCCYGPVQKFEHTREIQVALRRKGYYKGAIDNEIGPKTKKALVQFQKNKGLPIGTLNEQTLRALGVL